MEHAHKIHVLMRSALHETSAQDTIYSNGPINFKLPKILGPVW